MAFNWSIAFYFLVAFMQHFPTTISIRAILDETVVRELLLRFESPRLARSSAPSSKSSGCLSPLSARRGPFRKSSFFPRFSSASGVVSLRSKFRGPLFDVTKRSRSSKSRKRPRSPVFPPILGIDRFRNARGRRSRRKSRYIASSCTPFLFR